MKAVHRSDTGALVSVGSVVADPLPDGLAAVDLTQQDADGLRSGARRWNVATRSCEANPSWVDPAIATTNRATIEEQAALGLATMQAIIDSPQVTFTTVAQAQTQMRQLQAQVKDEARVLRRLIRLAIDDVTGTD